MPLVCDLHTHSTFSDGVLTPAQLVEEAHRCGVNVLALTDHDAVAGIPEAQDCASRLGLELLPGIELSVTEDSGRRHMHILGLGIDPSEPTLLAHVARFQEERRRRGRRIVELLNAQGIPLHFDQVVSVAGPSAIGRPHVARALVDEGICTSEDDAFARFLRRGRPAYVPREGPDAGAAIRLIQGTGGIASLAHPPLSAGIDAPGGLHLFVARLVRLGLDALEVYHPSHKRSMRKRLRQLARKHDLIMTGGSDFHGTGHSETRLGPEDAQPGQEALDALRKRLAGKPPVMQPVAPDSRR
jgi:predicted metal-dependent phosphoesterase TrpH